MRPVADVVVIGERAAVEPFALAGALPVVAEDAAAVRAALAGPGRYATIIVLTARAGAAAGLGPDGSPIAPGVPLIVVMPP
ncbi:MAG: hypothetical protein ACXV3A_07755 [Kineosporiaceae bacterium]